MALKRKPATGKEEGEAPAKKAKAGALAVGQLIADAGLSDYELLREDDTPVKLGDLVKERGIVIFMYPRANTGGCTKQACGFRDRIEEFTTAGYDVYGMSFDKPKSQSNWKAKYSLSFHLLTDAEGDLLKAFGALKAAKSILRSHVIIGKGGELLVVENGISPGDSFAQAAEFVAAHKQGGSSGDSKAEAEAKEEKADGDKAAEEEEEKEEAGGEEQAEEKAAPKKGKGWGKKK
ncbi:hypothetical protein ABPG75_012662 [Micractinium tetrahymenae]